MEGPFEDKSLELFLPCDLGIGNLDRFETIMKAWENIARKGKYDLGKKNCIAKEPYL